VYQHLAPLVAVVETTLFIVFHVGRLGSSSIYLITTYSNRKFLRKCIRFGDADVINVCLLKYNSVSYCKSAVGTDVFIILLC